MVIAPAPTIAGIILILNINLMSNMEKTMAFDSQELASFKNENGEVKLTKLGEAFIVGATPKYGDPVTNSHGDQMIAERDFSYFQHYFTK